VVLSAIMGIVCILLIVFLYIFSGGWKTYGGAFGIWKWLSQGGLSNPNGRSRRRPVQKVPEASEFADILEEIYREFTDKLQKQNEEIQSKLDGTITELRRVVRDLENRVSCLEIQKKAPHKLAATVACAIVQRSEEKCSPLEEPVYFRILDALRKGMAPGEVANYLKVPLQDVKSVLSIMSTPGNKD
jgi:hypothetical protein